MERTMNSQQIRVFGALWCGDCRRAKRFFDDHDISYEWIDTDQDKQAEQYVRLVNHGKRIIPTILFPDGSILVEPSNSELAAKFNIVMEDR